jgi:hypothetical protein
METIIFSVFIMILAHNLDKKLLIENLALRQQLLVMRRAVKRPKIRKRDRLLWVILSRLWKGWKSPLVVVQPEYSDSLAQKRFQALLDTQVPKKSNRPASC